MNITPEEYAKAVIRKLYKTETPYNLARTIARVADKYAKWISTSTERDKSAMSEGSKDPYVYEQQYEAQIKREAYRLALLMLTEKLPKA
jgi:hypothetical protein